METTLLVDRYGYDSVILEIRNEWLEEILMHLGVDPGEMDELSDSEIYDFFFENEIEIINYPSSGALKVLFEDSLIGEWAGPEFYLIKDEDTNMFCFEVRIEHWSIIEEEMDSS